MSVASSQDSVVRIVNVNVLDNPSPITHAFQFEVVFESSKDLNEDLEWHIVYVGDHRSPEGDQMLDSILVGPVSRGTHKFCFQANAPDYSKIPEGCLLGLTVVLLSCCYKSQEFVRIGYYVNNICNTPWKQYSQIERTILTDKPRIVHFPISWSFLVFYQILFMQSFIYAINSVKIPLHSATKLACDVSVIAF